MKSNYKRLGEYIRAVDYRNSENITNRVLGISIDKYFMPSVANVIGTDLGKYKLLKKGFFACNPMHVGRDERLPVALYDENTPAIISPAYFMFEVRDSRILDPEYLMLWFRRAEFDRQCWFRTDASVRGGITWEALCEVGVNVPPLERQLEIVKTYKTIEERIAIIQKVKSNLLQQAKAIFHQQYEVASEQIALTSMINIFGGGTPNTEEPNFWDGPIPFFTPKDVGAPYTFLTEKSITKLGLMHCNSRLYPKNTTFVTARGTVGKVCLAGIPMAMNQSCYALISQKIDPILVYFYVLEAVESLKHKASGAVFDAIVTRDFDKEVINVLNEETSKCMLHTLVPIMKLIQTYTEESIRLTILKESLLPRLLSDELVVF